MFYNCTGLTSVTIGNSVTAIRGRAFEGCSSLESICIWNSVNNINREAFDSCTSLRRIVVANDNSVHDSRNNCNLFCVVR